MSMIMLPWSTLRQEVKQDLYIVLIVWVDVYFGVTLCVMAMARWL